MGKKDGILWSKLSRQRREFYQKVIYSIVIRDDMQFTPNLNWDVYKNVTHLRYANLDLTKKFRDRVQYLYYNVDLRGDLNFSCKNLKMIQFMGHGNRITALQPELRVLTGIYGEIPPVE